MKRMVVPAAIIVFMLSSFGVAKATGWVNDANGGQLAGFGVVIGIGLEKAEVEAAFENRDIAEGVDRIVNASTDSRQTGLMSTDVNSHSSESFSSAVRAKAAGNAAAALIAEVPERGSVKSNKNEKNDKNETNEKDEKSDKDGKNDKNDKNDMNGKIDKNDESSELELSSKLIDELKLGMTRDEVNEQFGAGYVDFHNGLDDTSVWRYDYRDGISIKPELSNTSADEVDVDGLLNGTIQAQLFLNWNDQGTVVSRFALYYVDKERMVVEYRMFQDGQIRKTIIAG